MTFFTRADLVAGIQDADLLLHLDDDADGAEDAQLIESLNSEAEKWIMGYLEQAGVEMPSSIPARLQHCAIKYAEYLLWSRRKAAERADKVYEQWIAPAMAWLDKIARGVEVLLPADADDETPPGAITETAKTTSSGGSMMI